MTEIWKDIKGFEGICQVSNLGRIKSLPRYSNHIFGKQLRGGKILKQTKDKKGYCRVNISNKGICTLVCVHRIIAQAFIPNPENKPQINHINGHPYDNTLDNLEWCTNGENQKHAYKIGLQKRKYGNNSTFKKLNEKQVRVIKWIRIINPKLSAYKVADMFKVGYQIIYNIWNNKNWQQTTI